MALNPHEVPVTREQVYGWLMEVEIPIDPDDLKGFLEGKLGEDANLMVTMLGPDNKPGEMTLLDVIMADIDSYGIDFDADSN